MAKPLTCIVLNAPQDSALARKICLAVSTHGLKPVQLPWSGFGEDRVPAALKRKVDAAFLVILVLSLDFERSEAMRAITKYAFSVKKTLIPYKIHPRKPGYGLQIMLASAHWLDVSARERPENGIPELHRAIEGHLENFRAKRRFRGVVGTLGRIALCAGAAAVIFAGIFFGLNRALDDADPFLDGEVADSWDGGSNAPAEPEKTGDLPENAAEKKSGEQKAAPHGVGELENKAGTDESADDAPSALSVSFKNAAPMNLLRVPATSENGKTKPAFLLGETEVTQAQYLEITGKNPSFFTGDDRRPVEQVLWSDAMNFCALLTAREHAAGTLSENLVFSLPTVTQWLRAINGEKPLTEAELDRVAWFAGNSAGTTHPVATKAPNSLGFRDLCGNVWEWCLNIGWEWYLDINDRKYFCGLNYDKTFANFSSNPRLMSAVPSVYRKSDIGFRVALVRKDSLSAETLEQYYEATDAAATKTEIPQKQSLPLSDGLKMEFIRVPAGTTNDVKIPEFLLGKTEVTQAQYRAITGKNPSLFLGDDRRPVEQVSWDDAMDFCVMLTVRAHAAGTLDKDFAVSLPTRYQWQRALNGEKPQTETELDRVAWFIGNSAGTTHPVAAKAPNSLGFYDLVGNVWEWCLDIENSFPFYGEDYSKPFSWILKNKSLGSTTTYSAYRKSDVGFRAAIVPKNSLTKAQQRRYEAVEKRVDQRQTFTPPMASSKKRREGMSAEDAGFATERLIDAVRNQDFGKAEAALNFGADPDAQNAGRYLLEICANSGLPNFVELLLRYGATPFLPSANKYDAMSTCLHSEASGKIADLLCDYGFPVNGQNAWNATFLRVACEHDNENVGRVLVSYGADPDKTDGTGGSARSNAESIKSQQSKTWEAIFRTPKTKSPTYGNGKYKEIPGITLIEITQTVSLNKILPLGVAEIDAALRKSVPRTFFPIIREKFIFLYRCRTRRNELFPTTGTLNGFFLKNAAKIVPVNDLAASMPAVRRELARRKPAGFAVPMHATAAFPQIDAKADYVLLTEKGGVLKKGAFPRDSAQLDALFSELESLMELCAQRDATPRPGTQTTPTQPIPPRKNPASVPAEKKPDEKKSVAAEDDEPVKAFNRTWSRILPNGVFSFEQNFRAPRRTFYEFFGKKDYVFVFTCLDDSEMSRLANEMDTFRNAYNSETVLCPSTGFSQSQKQEFKKKKVPGYIAPKTPEALSEMISATKKAYTLFNTRISSSAYDYFCIIFDNDGNVLAQVQDKRYSSFLLGIEAKLKNLKQTQTQNAKK